MKTGELKINSTAGNLVFFQCELIKESIFGNKSFVEKFFAYMDDNNDTNWLSSHVANTGKHITAQYSDKIFESLKAKLILKLKDYDTI